MPERIVYVALLLVAALLPAFDGQAASASATEPGFPGFPAPFGSAAAPELPLAESEQAFLRSFPGKVAKFGDAHTQYIVRWITAPTRRLHPAVDCFRASGHAISPEPSCAGCFVATRDGKRAVVSEEIRDRNGRSFGDVSAWYWAASRGTSPGPWWSITTVKAQ